MTDKDRIKLYEQTLLRAQRLCKEALPKFNWGASALDADSIRLLNDVPIEIDGALIKGRSS